MSFLRRLFGSKVAAETAEADGPSVEHKGYTIKATPYVAQGQHQLCGVIEREVGGELKSARFIRADRFAAREDAEQAALAKGRQIVDEQGDKVFG